MGLSLALAAFFKYAQLIGFAELDKVTRQLRAAQATPTMATGTALVGNNSSRRELRRVWASRRRSRLLAGR